MPFYISHHDIPRLEARELCEFTDRLKTSPVVRCLRSVGEPEEGKLFCRWESPDPETLMEFLEDKGLAAHWIMKVEHTHIHLTSI